MGAPRRYRSVKALQEAIDKYFAGAEGKPLLDDKGNVMTDKNGNPVFVGKYPITVTGLALALGFNSRQTLLNYQERPEFMDTIKRAKCACEAYAEARLYDRDGARGAQFSLEKNFKWGNEAEKDDSSDLTVSFEGDMGTYGE